MDATRIKAVIAGCGGISNAWLTAAKNFDDLEIVGFCDLKLENAETRRESSGVASAAVGTDLAALIDMVRPDAVFDCSVPEAHCAVVTTALAKGCHVLGEKPMADSMASARKMVEAAERAGKIYAVTQTRSYTPGILKFRSAVQGGDAGALTTLNADFYLGAHFGGFRDVMDHVLLLDMAIHAFDAARFISGASAETVYCREWNPSKSWYKHGASACAIFEMGGGVVFNYRGSWCSEGFPTSWNCDWRALCEDGSFKWDGEDNVTGQRVANGEGFTRQLADIPVAAERMPFTGHAGVMREFLDCVKNGGAPRTAAADNIKSLAMVHAAVKSAETGERVNVEL